MTEAGIVVGIYDGFIKVKRTAPQNCNTCRIRHICGSENLPEFTIKTNEEYKIGELVDIIIDPKGRLFAVTLFYIMPIIIFLCSYIISVYILKFSEYVSIILSFLSLGLSFFIVIEINKKLKHAKFLSVSCRRVE